MKMKAVCSYRSQGFCLQHLPKSTASTAAPSVAGGNFPGGQALASQPQKSPNKFDLVVLEFSQAWLLRAPLYVLAHKARCSVRVRADLKKRRDSAKLNFFCIIHLFLASIATSSAKVAAADMIAFDQNDNIEQSSSQHAKC